MQRLFPLSSSRWLLAKTPLHSMNTSITSHHLCRQPMSYAHYQSSKPTLCQKAVLGCHPQPLMKHCAQMRHRAFSVNMLTRNYQPSMKLLSSSKARFTAAKFPSRSCFLQSPMVARQWLPRARVAGMSSEATAMTSGVDRLLGNWLLFVSGGVLFMILLGGVTRLTRSGLSMVDWKLQGRKLPSTEAEWLEEFEKYKQFPEYKKVNFNISLEEFKSIYFLEWLHRMAGRALGFAYGIPVLYFFYKYSFHQPGGKGVSVIRNLRMKLGCLFLLGGLQGLIGWWMVKSGLDHQANMVEYKEPRVDPKRLATHLFAAMVLYTYSLWLAFTVFHPRSLVVSNLEGINATQLSKVKRVKKLGGLALGFAGITFISGAFVAGNDAGFAYNDWPLYAGEYIPEEAKTFYSSFISDLGNQLTAYSSYRPLMEDTGVVQFNHRNLAYSTLLSVSLLLLSTRRAVNLLKNMPDKVQLVRFAKRIETGAFLVGGVAVAQVCLGISTLMLIVPTPLAVFHQAGAVTLWTATLYFNHLLRYIHF